MRKAKAWDPTPAQKSKALREARAYIERGDTTIRVHENWLYDFKRSQDRAIIEKALTAFYGVSLDDEVPF